MKQYVLLALVMCDGTDFSPKDLQGIFKSKHPDIVIVNHKVLKDENGLSRGVGFAR